MALFQVRCEPCRQGVAFSLLGSSEQCLLLGRLQECEAGSSGALLDESSVFASALSSRSCAEEFLVCISGSIQHHKAGDECSISGGGAALIL